MLRRQSPTCSPRRTPSDASPCASAGRAGEELGVGAAAVALHHRGALAHRAGDALVEIGEMELHRAIAPARRAPRAGNLRGLWPKSGGPATTVPSPPRGTPIPAFAALEHERLWSRVWQIAGREEQVADARRRARVPDRRRVGRSCTRDRDGALHAMRNACRHRGSPLVQDAPTWTTACSARTTAGRYELDGRLRAVVDADDFGDRLPEGLRARAGRGRHVRRVRVREPRRRRRAARRVPRPAGGAARAVPPRARCGSASPARRCCPRTGRR